MNTIDDIGYWLMFVLNVMVVILFLYFAILAKSFAALACKLRLVQTDTYDLMSQTEKVNLIFTVLLGGLLTLLTISICLYLALTLMLVKDGHSLVTYRLTMANLWCLNIVLVVLVSLEVYAMYYLR